MSDAMREPTETRPWGAFYVLDEGRGFKVKRIVVTPQGRLSLQSHKHRAEHWTVVSGEATVTVGEAVQTLTRGAVRSTSRKASCTGWRISARATSR